MEVDTEKVRDMALETTAHFRTPGTLSAWPYWKFPTARWEDKMEMTQLFRELLAMTGREKELTITANTMLHELHRHSLHDFCGPTPQQIDQTTFTEIGNKSGARRDLCSDVILLRVLYVVRCEYMWYVQIVEPRQERRDLRSRR